MFFLDFISRQSWLSNFKLLHGLMVSSSYSDKVFKFKSVSPKGQNENRNQDSQVYLKITGNR